MTESDQGAQRIRIGTEGLGNPCARLLGRMRAHWRLKHSVGLWYHAEYSPRCLAGTSRVAHLPLDRVDLAVGQLASEGALRPGDLHTPRLASFEQLARVHSAAYLESTTRPETLARIFGLEPAVVEADPLLLAQRRAVGGTIAAARVVAQRRLQVGFNLGGGFHHAEPEQGSGFCVFNDVAVAIALLREWGFDWPIAVVDLDFHQGNGTAQAFAEDESVLTYSIHGAVWSHLEARADVAILLPPGTGDAQYVERLRETLPAELARQRPRLVFYLTGNDVLDGDPLGGFALTPAGVLERDRLVVESARAIGAGLVLTLAGGYSPDAWSCSANLLRWLLTGVAMARRSAREGLRERFAQIARGLDPAALQAGADDSFVLTEAEVLGDLDVHRVSPRLFGYYTLHGIEYALERYGLFEKLRRKGFVDLRLSAEARPGQPPVLRLHGRRPEASGDPLLLMELVAQVGVLPPLPGADSGLRVLSIEWLLLQDPSAAFSLERPPLPGQKHPGLGLAHEVLEMLVRACVRLELDALKSRPAHYHTAVVGARDLRFVDPVLEGRLLATREVLREHGLPEAAGLVEAGALRLRNGSVLSWQPGDQVFPVAAAVRAYFEGEAYVRVRDAERARVLGAGLHVDESAALPKAQSRSRPGHGPTPDRRPPPRPAASSIGRRRRPGERGVGGARPESDSGRPPPRRRALGRRKKRA